MWLFRVPVTGIMFAAALVFSINAQNYYDDSLVVMEILRANGLDTIPVADVSGTVNGRIGSLYLNDKNLTVLPECIGRLDSLTFLSLSRNQLTSLPLSLGSLTNLQEIDACDNFISALPEGFSNLQKLKIIYLIRNRFTRWPEAFTMMPNMTMIDLGVNHLISIPEEVCSYPSLRKLYLNDNYLTELPECIVNLDLEVVHVAGNALCSVSPAITAWLDSCDYYKENRQWLRYQWCSYFFADSSVLRRILDTNGWRGVGVASVAEVVNGNIVSIDLSYNNLSAHQLAKRSTATANPMILDSGIITFRYLRALNLAGNNIDTVPQWFAGCCHLKALDLSNNRLSTLPGFMTSFRQLESLNLSGNQIANLPVQTAQWADAYAPDWKNTQSTTSTAGSQRGQTIEKILRRSFFDGGKLQVTFSQPVYAEVVLYALSGRKIVVIAKQHFESGLHSFNIKNVQLPCGTYMVTIKAGNSMLETLRFVAH